MMVDSVTRAPSSVLGWSPNDRRAAGGAPEWGRARDRLALGHWGVMVALVLAAVSVGLSNFAAAVAIGVSGVDARTRLEVGVVFGVFEVGMPILGLALGHSLADTLGSSARWLGGGLLSRPGSTAWCPGSSVRGRARRADRADPRAAWS